MFLNPPIIEAVLTGQRSVVAPLLQVHTAHAVSVRSQVLLFSFIRFLIRLMKG